MTPADLKPIIDRMTPGKWSSLGLHIISDEAGSVADMWTRDDIDAVIALRNHADALIKCAELLPQVRALLSEGEGLYHREINGPEADRLCNEIDEALKHMENIK
jgi:hypothetical protein